MIQTILWAIAGTTGALCLLAILCAFWAAFATRTKIDESIHLRWGGFLFAIATLATVAAVVLQALG